MREQIFIHRVYQKKLTELLDFPLNFTIAYTQNLNVRTFDLRKKSVYQILRGLEHSEIRLPFLLHSVYIFVWKILKS